MMKRRNSTYRVLLKTISTLVVCLFLINNIAWAEGNNFLARDSAADLASIGRDFAGYPGHADSAWTAFSEDRGHTAGASAQIQESPEYKVMLREIRQLIKSGNARPVISNAYSHIRKIAEKELRDFNPGRADEAILEIKRWLTETTFNTGERETVRQLMLSQAREYFDLVAGFGAIAYNAGTDQMEDLNPREEEHEDIFSASMQAVDTLERMGQVNALSDLIALTQRGLEAHKEKVNLEAMQKRVDNARKQQNKDDERKYNIVLSSNFEAVRRWMGMENMLLKCVSNLGLCAGEANPEFKQANSFLNAVMLNYQATGEAYYWVRQQAAYRLRDYPTEDTTTALNLATDKNKPEGQAPHPATVFVAMNLEAANPNALTIGLAAGMSMLHIQRVKAEKEIIASPETFNFEQKQYRFVRLLGALDALKREDIDNDKRIRIMECIAGIRNDEAAFAANFLLDAMEEMVKGQRNIYARIFKSDRIAKELEDPRIRLAAFKVISRIAGAILPRLEAKNALLAGELSLDIIFLNGVSKGSGRYDAERFRKIGRKLHVTLGNLHRLEELKSFDQGEEYLNFNRNVVIGSGGGASVSMSGVIDRITTDPALAIIGATDNGGATLLVRSFEAIQNGIFVGGFGDHIRFMYEAAVLEGVPGALMIKDVLDHRFGHGTKALVDEVKAQYSDKLKKARQSGPKEEERFEEVYQKLLEVAARVDAAGLNGDFNSIKNMIMEGLMYQTEGIGKELMNPDGIYAAFEAFRRLLGAKSMAVPDIPIGNEIIVRAIDGEEYIGQSYYSHTPRGFNRGRQRSTLRITGVDNYYPDVSIRSRIMGVISRAKLLLFGLGSWATSVGILFKNKSLVSAVADNASADKLLITNPVCDDETRGMSWRESTVNFLENLMGRRLGEVFNRILANANRNLNRPILTARPHLGTVEQVYDGYFGGYAGENTPSPDDIDYIQSMNMKVVTDLEMASVRLSPMRVNPDLYNATVQYVPELFAEGLWSSMSDTAKESLGTKREVELIKRKDEVEKLLHGKGLTLLDLGIEQIHEVIYNPILVKELSEWLNDSMVPAWIEDKNSQETMFQFIVRKAVERAAGHVQTGAPTNIKLEEEIVISKIRDKDVKIKFLSQQETDKTFPSSRVLLADDTDALRDEELHRLGIIRGPTGGRQDILILLPYDLLEAGDLPEDRIKRIEVALSFQLEKAKKLLENNFTDETLAHQNALESFSRIAAEGRKDYCAVLAELSAAIPYLRFLRSSIAEGKIPNTIFDMDGAFTAAGTPLTPKMAYHAWKFFKSPGILKTVMTAQQFEGPFKQIVEEVEQITRRLRWISVRTGVNLEEGTTGNDFLAQVPIAVSSGGAVFLYDRKKQGYVKVCQESMDDFTVSFIELAARLTMPDVGYPVDGHQIETREPHRQPDGSTLFAAMAVIPSGRYDTRRNWDPRPAFTQRILQGNRMAEILKNPANLLKQVEGFIAARGNGSTWKLIIGNGESQEIITVLPEQYDAIGDICGRIRQLFIKNEALRENLNKPIDISHQPGGDTTIDFSPVGKGPRIPLVVGAIGLTTNRVDGDTMNFVPPISGASPTDKGPRIPMVKQAVEHYKGVARDRMADAVLGDEMSTATLRHDDRGMKAVGNDFSVAEETARGTIHPTLLVHVGPTGENIETLPNTSTLYGKSGLMPHDVDHLLAYSAANIHRGKACGQIEEDADIRSAIEHALASRGRSLSEFGIESFKTMNERQAQELFLLLRLGGEPVPDASAVRGADIYSGPRDDTSSCNSIPVKPGELAEFLDKVAESGQLDEIDREKLDASIQKSLGFEGDTKEVLLDRFITPIVAPAPREKIARLFDHDFVPGTFMLGERMSNPEFLKTEDKVGTMRQWIHAQVKSEIARLEKADPGRVRMHFLDNVESTCGAPIEDLVFLTLFLRCKDGRKFMDTIPNQIFQDIFLRIISVFIWRHAYGYPDTDIEFDNKIGTIVERILPDMRSKSLKELFWYSVAAGALGLDLKSNASAASIINNTNVVPFNHGEESTEERKERMYRELANMAEKPMAIDFWPEFEQQIVKAVKPVSLVFFHDDYGETIFDLLFIQKLLQENPNISVVSVPRSNRCGNDAAPEDIYEKINSSYFEDLWQFIFTGRYSVCYKGPGQGAVSGLDFSEEVVDFILKSEAIMVKGARSYEMLQGIKKDAYFAYMVCREYSETVTGVDSNTGLSVFIKQETGLPSFEGFKKRHLRNAALFDTNRSGWIASMTALEYAKVVKGPQYQAILRGFDGDKVKANRWIKDEAKKKGVTVAQVIAEEDIGQIHEYMAQVLCSV